jgi:hypothetical protein
MWVAAVSGPSWALQTGAPAAGQDPQIVWRSGPHWLPASPTEKRVSFTCEGRSISYRLGYGAGRRDAPTRLVMQRLEVDGRPVGRERLAAVNEVLASFRALPEVRPECSRRQIRVTLSEVERGRVARSHSVPLDQVR